MSSVRSSSGRGGRKLKNEINVVPYIDVMLVLLVIFMVTAPLITPGIIELPTVGQAKEAPTVPTIEIQIDEESKILWRVRESGSSFKPVDRNSLAQTILSELKPDQPVVISADKKLLYGSVVDVLEDLRKNGVKKISLMVDQKDNSASKPTSRTGKK